MIQSLQVVLALLAPSLLLVAPVRADGDQDKGPEDVLKAFAAAMKKEDVKAMMSHVTRDSESRITGMIGLLLSLSKSFSQGFFNHKPTPEEQKHIDAIDAILKRHGVSEEALLKKLGNGKEPPTQEEITRNLVAIGESVKDKRAFVAEVMKYYTARLEDTPDIGFDGFKEIGQAKVKEVKIDGQQARSQVTFPGADGKEGMATIYFKLESGVWKIDLIETNRNWPQPPPLPQVQPPATQVRPPAVYYDCRPGLLRRWCPCLRP
jgi:hypothetical protein